MATIDSKIAKSRIEARKLFIKENNLKTVIVPRAYHIHHKDFNPLNNNINNLELLSPVEHVAKHRPKRILSKPEIIIRLANVPEPVRRKLKAQAAIDGKTMQAIILDLIIGYIKGKQ